MIFSVTTISVFLYFILYQSALIEVKIIYYISTGVTVTYLSLVYTVNKNDDIEKVSRNATMSL